MNVQVEDWRAANQTALTAALRPVLAALCHAAGTEAPPERDAPLALMTEPPSALETLCRLFGLTNFERDLLLLCAGAELDGRFADTCATIHRDPKRTAPTFGLALAVLPAAHWSALTPDRPLRYWRMIEPLPGESLAGSALRIDERILHFLAGVITLAAPPPRVPAWLTDGIDRAVYALRAGERVLLTGRSAVDRESAAVAALIAVGCTPFRLRAADLPTAPLERETLSRHWNREAALSAGGLHIQVETVDASSDAARLLPVHVTRMVGAIVLDAEENAAVDGIPGVRVGLAPPTIAERRRAWQDSLGPDAPGVAGMLNAIADQFRIDTTAIHSAAVALRRVTETADGAVLEREAWRICREHARRSMEQLARRIEPRATWDDLVLPEGRIAVLRQIAVHLRQRATVLEEWGFAAKYARGLGLSALFSGASGTGKTMAAEVLAHTLGLDLFQIDLASLVSKYIGETEKNLKRVFDAAEDSGAILLFDEADALFGKRTEVKDSHDRYANLEVSYLLQRMEAYRGLAILTTNMRQAIDTAFLRRIRFMVDFPFPDAEHRARIWRGVFPAGTPISDFDPDRLAHLNITGGIIRNIAMQAAFLAADQGGQVRMSHLLDAARTEYAKLERPMGSMEREIWR